MNTAEETTVTDVELPEELDLTKITSEFTIENASLKAKILRDPRPAFRACALRAYTAFHKAKDALHEGDHAEHREALADGISWLDDARAWDLVEVG
jgi:hypothetical protein